MDLHATPPDTTDSSFLEDPGPGVGQDVTCKARHDVGSDDGQHGQDGEEHVADAMALLDEHALR